MEQEQNKNITNEPLNAADNGGAPLSKQEEKAARKARLRKRRLERRAKHNARVARLRFFKNLFIWLLGVLFLPVAIAAASFVVPIGTFTGNNGEIVSSDLEKKSIFEAARFVAANPDELGFSDFPIIAKTFDDLQSTEIGDGVTIGDIVSIDTAKLNTIKFGSSTIADDVKSCVDVVATIESLGGASMLGDFGELSVFTEEDEAGTVAEISANGEDAETKLQYYYKPSELGTSSFSLTSAGYKRAFDKDGNLVDELNNLSETDKSTVKLYYPPLEKVKLSELVDIFGNSFGRTTVKSLLGIFGIEHTEENPSTIIKILGEDRTISGLGDFDINEVQLNVVLKEDSETQELWDVLKAATGKDAEGSDPVVIGDLTSFDLNSVKLNVVLKENSENQKLWDVLKAATGKDAEGSDPVVIGDLTSFDLNSVKLNVVLDEKEEPVVSDYATIEEYQAAYDDYETNKKLWDVLKAATNSDTDITLGDLANDFDMNNVRLNVVIDEKTEGEAGYEANKKLWDVLKAATGKDAENSDPITLNDLANDFDINNVKLNVVLTEKTEGETGYETNKKLWDVLKAATSSGSDITLGDLADDFDLDKVPLNNVIKEIEDDTDPEYDNNHKFWTILKQAVILEEGETIDDDHPVTVGHLSKGFEIENVKLTDVIAVNGSDAKNSKLWTILEQTVTDDDGNPLTRDEITLHDLNYHFTVDNICLTSVLDVPTADNGYKNQQIYDILLDATGESDYDSIKLNSLSSFTANNIHLNTVLENVDVSDNRVLSALKEKNITVGNIGSALNGLSLYEVYGVSSFKTDTAVSTLDLTRSFYRIFNEDGETVYMLESNGVVSAVPTDEYYICYDTSTLDMSYRLLTASQIDTSAEYDLDGKLYYKTMDNHYYVLKDTVLYKLTDDNSVDFYLDSRDLLVKTSAETYYACYDEEEFVGYFNATDAESAGYTYDNGVSYTKATDNDSNTVYVESQKYYLDKSAGIWLLLSFDTAEYSSDIATRRFADQKGKAYKYSVDTMKIEHLQKGSNFAKKFKNSTIKQLVDSGLVDDPEFNNQASYKYSLQELLDIMKAHL